MRKCQKKHHSSGLIDSFGLPEKFALAPLCETLAKTPALFSQLRHFVGQCPQQLMRCPLSRLHTLVYHLTLKQNLQGVRSKPSTLQNFAPPVFV
jgi:hypothetical protein